MRWLTRAKVEQEIRQMVCSPVERIEQPHLDVGVGIEDIETEVLAGEIEVVEQHADAHATVGRIEQGREQLPARRIAVPQEILDVDRLLGRGGKGVTAGKGFPARSHQLEARRSRMRGDLWRGKPSQRGRLGIGERGR
jgi:hypothetical protein